MQVYSATASRQKNVVYTEMVKCILLEKYRYEIHVYGQNNGSTHQYTHEKSLVDILQIEVREIEEKFMF